MSKEDDFLGIESEEKHVTYVYMKTDEENEKENNIAKKWKTTARNRRIIRWKLLHTLEELINLDFDKYEIKVNDNSDLINLLLSDNILYEYDICENVEDENNIHLKYGLEETALWKDLMNCPAGDLLRWEREYEYSFDN